MRSYRYALIYTKLKAKNVILLVIPYTVSGWNSSSKDKLPSVAGTVLGKDYTTLVKERKLLAEVVYFFWKWLNDLLCTVCGLLCLAIRHA